MNTFSLVKGNKPPRSPSGGGGSGGGSNDTKICVKQDFFSNSKKTRQTELDRFLESTRQRAEPAYMRIVNQPPPPPPSSSRKVEFSREVPRSLFGPSPPPAAVRPPQSRDKGHAATFAPTIPSKPSSHQKANLSRAQRVRMNENKKNFEVVFAPPAQKPMKPERQDRLSRGKLAFLNKAKYIKSEEEADGLPPSPEFMQMVREVQRDAGIIQNPKKNKLVTNTVGISENQEKKKNLIAGLFDSEATSKEEQKGGEYGGGGHGHSWSQMMVKPHQQHESYSQQPEDPVAKEYRRQHYNGISEFVVELLSKAMFRRKSAQAIHYEFRHPTHFKEQFITPFYIETAEQVLNEMYTDNRGGGGSSRRGGWLDAFQLRVSVPGHSNSSFGSMELEFFRINYLRTREYEFNAHNSKVRFPLRDNDLICLYNEAEGLTPASIKQDAHRRLLSDEIELGLVRKDPGKGDLQLILLADRKQPSWLDLSRAAHGFRICSLSTSIREYRTMNMVEFCILSYQIMIPNLFEFAHFRANEAPEWVQPTFGKHFNKQQVEAICRVAGMRSEDLFLLQGPPGTGKTTTVIGIISLVRLLLEREWKQAANEESLKTPKILVCAPSNKAVDEIMERLLRKGLLNGKGEFFKLNPTYILRMGIIDYDPPAIVLERHLDKLVEKELGNLHKSKSDFDERYIQKYGHRLEYFKIDLELKFSEQARGVVEPASSSDRSVSELLHKYQLEGFFYFYELEAARDGVVLRKIDAKIQEIKNKKKVMLKGIKDEKKRKLYLENKLMNEAEILCTTLSTSGTDKVAKFGSFDFLIVDEACQASELSTLIPIMQGVPRVLLVGDQYQLPQVVLSRDALSAGLGRSLFERVIEASGQPPFMLEEQYRMAPQIREFPSKQFYAGKLTDAKLIATRSPNKELRTLVPAQDPIHFYDLAFAQHSGKTSLKNADEANFVLCLYKYIVLHAAQQLKIPVSEAVWRLRASIGVISPYKEYVNLLRIIFSEFLGSHAYFYEQGHHPRASGLKKFIQIDSVDGFQGSEKDIIIISTVRGDASGGGIGFLSDYRRMNVAITRPKHFLMVVGNAGALRHDQNWGDMLSHLKSRGAYSLVEQTQAFVLKDFRIDAKPPLQTRRKLLRKSYVNQGSEEVKTEGEEISSSSNTSSLEEVKEGEGKQQSEYVSELIQLESDLEDGQIRDSVSREREREPPTRQAGGAEQAFQIKREKKRKKKWRLKRNQRRNK